MKYYTLHPILALIICCLMSPNSNAQKNTDWFERQFEKADALILEGLPRNAEPVYDLIFEKAKKENNHVILLRAINDRMINKCFFEENALLKVIEQLKTDIETLEFPVNQIAHSVLGNLYWQYYQQNRWRVQNRTPLYDEKNTDIEVWDLKRIVKEVISEFDQSIENQHKLGKFTVDTYNDILGGDDELRHLRPTLLDLLAHRALDIYKNSEVSVISPVDEFSISDKVYFGSPKEFIEYKVETTDSLSVKYKAVKLFQDLVRFHMNGQQENALIDIELLRLKYMHTESTHQSKDTLYQQSLSRLSKFASQPETKAEVGYHLASFLYSLDDDGPVNYLNQAIIVCNDVIENYPGTRGNEYCENLRKKISEHQLELKAERQVTPLKPFLVNLKYKNFNTVYFYLFKVDLNFIKQRGTYEQSEIEDYLKRKAIREWELELPEKKDYRMHRVEIPVSSLEKGFYVLLASDENKLNKNSNTNSVAFNVTDWFIMNRPGVKDKQIFSINHRASGIPVEKATFEFFEQHYNYDLRHTEHRSLGKVRSNKEGIVERAYDNTRVSIIVSKDGDSLYAPPRHIPEYYDDYYQDINTVLFTDRAIYRPGQTVYFKGLRLKCAKDNCEIVPNDAEEVTLYDPNMQELSSLKVKTNEYGTFNGSFTIPTGLLNGSYSIDCLDGGINILVEEYKRPTFEVTFTPLEKSYGYNDSVQVTGNARAYAGYPVDNSRVSYRVERETQSRWWWSWFNSQKKQVAVGKTNTDKDGNFTISYFTDDKDIKNKELIHVYTIYTDITDANGETRSGKHILRISSSSLIINSDIPEIIFTRNAPEINIETRNLNGDEVESDVEASIIKLGPPEKLLFDRPWEEPDVFVLNENQFREEFPNRVYRNETNPETWKHEKTVFNAKFKAEKEKPTLQKELSDLKQGYYKLSLSAKDEGNNTSEYIKVFQVLQDKPQVPVLVKDWIIPVKTSGEPGEFAEFLIYSLTPETPVKYEILLGEKIIKSDVLQPSKKPQKIKIPIEENYRGGFAAQFTQVAESQAFVSLQEIKVPYTNKMLDIAFSSFRDKLMPGENEQWKLTIKNKAGEKEPAEMLANLYDASLDAFAPLNWQTDFLSTREHGHLKWDEEFVPRLIYARQLARINTNLLNWDKKYEYLRFTYSYYGNYNPYFGNNEHIITQRIKVNRLKKKKEKEIGNTEKKVSYDEMFSVNNELFTEKRKPVGGNGKLSGIILDAETDSPIAGQVTFPGTKLSAKSDVNGKFILEDIPEGAWLKVFVEGFEIRKVQILSNNLTIYVFPDIEEFDAPVGFGESRMKSAEMAPSMMAMRKGEAVADAAEESMEANVEVDKRDEPEEIPIRKNFNETAFFYPDLKTDENGEVIIDFIIPDALTKWNMLGFAHTKGFKTGSVSNTLITQKDVSIMVNAPRFLRESDTIEFPAKVNNLSESEISGEATIQLIDPFTGELFTSKMLKDKETIPFKIEKGQSRGIRWKLVIPSGIQVVQYKVIAKAGKYTDGEESVLPVLVNSKLVTESLPFMVRGGKEETFRFDKMAGQKSPTLRNEAYTLEFTSNPAWYAVQAMPYLMEFPYECSEQVFSRFFANALSSTIVKSNPRIEEIFKTWAALDSDALVSNLEKNQELKELLIQETPWLLNAKDETERKKRVALLFDLNNMRNNLQSAFSKLKNKQTPNGGFAWFDGMPDNRYITQHITTGLAQLRHLKAVPPELEHEVNQILQRAMNYLDARIIEDYNELLKRSKKGLVKMTDNHLSSTHTHYLYCRSFFKDIPVNKDLKTPYEYFFSQAETYWLAKNEYEQGMIALAFHRSGNDKLAKKTIASLSNRATRSEELGMYWTNNQYGYFWHQAPIETQSLLIEAFTEITNDIAAVEEMKIWLLRNKQTNDWKTTKATVSACYALLLRGVDLLSQTKLLSVSLGNKPLETLTGFKEEAGTGYVKTVFKQDEIKPEFGEIKVKNPNEGIAWGAAYWQYFEQLDKITTAETNLKINKKLFVKKHTESGPVLQEIYSESPIKVGDEVVVRVEIRADRDFEYVHLKDMRASGFEPTSTISQYKYQDGLGYYESVKDASQNFFIGFMRKGTYVFEYSLRAVHSGYFSNGITTMQCMYAPEFTTHSDGIRVQIEE